jgi:hypothetical protein
MEQEKEIYNYGEEDLKKTLKADPNHLFSF